jgi:cytochrome c oxidase accessory protein FixG
MNADIKDLYEEQEAEASFRDRIATVDEKGKRIWIYPKKPSGKFTNYRGVVSIFLLTILFAGPFIKIGGQPLLLVHLLERRFVLFGQIFWPQDFHLFVIGMITLVVFIILFTVVYGRIFCGWICPQTIFMEFVFRKIEYWIEGDYMAQRKLDKQPWDTEKIIKKTTKQLIFILISALIMHTFMAYIVGIEQTWEIITEGPAKRPGGFIAMVALTGAFYGVFSKLREQVCTTICPYGRLQGVLLDRNSVVVAYDHVRGETRAKFRKDEDRSAVGKGDCIDCKQCVFVCPTGIDIRHGTQLECVNCTACMDACDSIMDRIGKLRGLVRYASEASIVDKVKFSFTWRAKAYSAVLVFLVGVLVTLLVVRSDFETTVLRTPGVMFQTREDGTITNLYQLKLVNKTMSDMDVRFELIEPNGTVEVAGKTLTIPGQGIQEGAMLVVIHPDHLETMSTKIKIGVYGNGKLVETVKTRFLGPMK